MESQKHKFIELRAEGYSFDAIAKKLKKAKGTLLEWNKELAEEIASCKALHLECLYEKYYMLRENRLQLFGEILIKLKEELANRNLANIPTEKLLELIPKYQTLLKEEFIELQFLTEEEIQEKKQQKQELESLISLLSNQYPQKPNLN